MPQDTNLALQASVTKTATFNGSWVKIPGLAGHGGRLWAHVLYSAATNASGSNSVTFSLDVSPDNGTTVYAAEFNAADQVINLSTTAQSGELSLPFNLLLKNIKDGANPAIRLTATIAGAGSTPTITYSGNISVAFN